ncbi:MAG: hypothetical protein KKA05_08090, partial [Alphaproteobacteria bacterium]|nr:hypothetical protein [Alphaproteobacteria bacterium]
ADQPLLVLDREGEGRVGMVLSDNAWMWARGYEGGGPYADLMTRMSHWLLKEPALEEEALRLNIQSGQLTVERQSMGDNNAPVILTNPMGTTQQLTLNAASPGLWSVTVPIDQQGIYTAVQGELSTIANAGPASPREFADMRSTATVLQPLVDATGGQIVRMTDAGGALALPRIVPLENVTAETDRSGSDWLGVRMSAVSDLRGTNRYSPLSGWLAFTLVIGLLAGAWLREGDPAATRRLGDKVRGLWGRNNNNSGPTL